MGKATEEPRRPPITREAALRIALAARAMLNSPPPWLLNILGVAAEKRLKNYSAQGEAALAGRGSPGCCIAWWAPASGWAALRVANATSAWIFHRHVQCACHPFTQFWEAT